MRKPAEVCLGASVADIFDEVNEDLRAEKAQQLARRYGGPAVLLVLLIALAIGGWQAWRWNQARQAGDVAGAFIAAAREAGPPDAAAPDAAKPDAGAAQAGFDRLIATAPAGYRSLARLRDAALRAGSGDLPGALQQWNALAGDTSADPLLRDLASLLWAQHQVDGGDPAAVNARLQPLTAQNSPWRPLALESQALLALRTGHADQAHDILRGLAADASAPNGLHDRVNGLLARLGDAVAAPPAEAPPSDAPAGAGE